VGKKGNCWPELVEFNHPGGTDERETGYFALKFSVMQKRARRIVCRFFYLVQLPSG
jgi:hypothetical protein